MTSAGTGPGMSASLAARGDGPVPGAVSPQIPAPGGTPPTLADPGQARGLELPALPVWQFEPGPVPLWGRLTPDEEVRRDYELDAGVDYDERDLAPPPELWGSWEWVG